MKKGVQILGVAFAVGMPLGVADYLGARSTGELIVRECTSAAPAANVTRGNPTAVPEQKGKWI